LLWLNEATALISLEDGHRRPTTSTSPLSNCQSAPCSPAIRAKATRAARRSRLFMTAVRAP